MASKHTENALIAKTNVNARRNWFTEAEARTLRELAQAVVAYNIAARNFDRASATRNMREVEAVYADISEMTYTGTNGKFFAVACNIYRNAGAEKFIHVRANVEERARRREIWNAQAMGERAYNSQLM